MAALRAFLDTTRPRPSLATSEHESKRIVKGEYGQWRPGPIPKLRKFIFWGRAWEVKVSQFPFMGWGLFALEAAKAGDELLPFVGPELDAQEFRIAHRTSPRFRRYALAATEEMFVDGDVELGNVAGFINSSEGRSEIQNCQWDFVPLPAPWNPSHHGYVITVASRDIVPGDELFAEYRVGK